MKTIDRARWIKIGVFAFAAIDCMGVYAARQQLNSPVPDSELVDLAPVVAYSPASDLPTAARLAAAEVAMPTILAAQPAAERQASRSELPVPAFGKDHPVVREAKVVVPSVRVADLAPVRHHTGSSFASAFGAARGHSALAVTPLGADPLPTFSEADAGTGDTGALRGAVEVANTDVTGVEGVSPQAAAPTSENPFPAAPTQGDAAPGRELPALPSTASAAPTA